MRKLFAGKVKSFAQDKKGATMVEYGVIVALVAAVCIVAVTTLGTDINGAFGKINTALTNAGLGK